MLGTNARGTVAPAVGGICRDATSVHRAGVKVKAMAEVTPGQVGRGMGSIGLGRARGPAQSPRQLPQVLKLDQGGNFSSI